MHNLITLIIISTCLFCSGCHASMTGKVVDAETGKPIEGAILLVEWTKAKGMVGLTHTVSAKAAEVLSDKDGNVTVPGYFNPLADGPYITIYKPGYVAWNNYWIFPGYKKREDFAWTDGYIFQLNTFKDGYSYYDHDGFIYSCARGGLPNPNKHQLSKMHTESENNLIRQELDNKAIRR